MNRLRYQGVLVAATIAAVAWGALAFGAVYPWAYATLGVLCGGIGCTALFVERTGRPPIKTIGLAFAAALLAISIQAAPLPSWAVSTVSPGVQNFLRAYTLEYGVLHPPGVDGEAAGREMGEGHALSLAPQRTLVGLGLFAALSMFLLGVSRLLSATGAARVAFPLVAFGVILAVIGIGQFTLTSRETHPLIYGFWKPMGESRPFGPYVNPNHFAGWMVMAVPVVLGLFYEALERTREAAAERRRSISLFSTPEFGSAMMLGFSAIVMGLSLLMTRSRSGLAAFAAGSLLAGWMIVRRQTTARAKGVVALAFVLVVAGAGAWAGLDTVTSKIFEAEKSNSGMVSVGGRLGAWRNTLSIIRDFPVTGTGFNTYGTAMTIYQTDARELHFQEAHNDYLQIAAEGGLLVGIPIVVLLVIFVRQVRQRFEEAPKYGVTYWLRVGAVIGLVSIGLQSIVEFSLQMPGNAALFAVLAAIALHQSPRLRTASVRAAGSAPPPKPRLTPSSVTSSP